jgi:exodeoxyribonuclease III
VSPSTLLALNVSTPTPSRAQALLELLWPADDDVWVLTETSAGEGTRLIAQVCRAAGHRVHVTDLAGAGGRGVMVVVRRPDLRAEAEELDGPTVLPGRVLPLQVVAGERRLRLLGVYGAASDPVRYSSSAQRRRKREWLVSLGEWLRAWQAARPELPAVVLGDLNLVDPLHDDELPYVLPEETAMLEALRDEHGLTDAFRHLHPTSTQVSWVDHSGVGCRYDHAFVTADLVPSVRACDLVQAPLEAGLTDHAAVRLQLGEP